LAQYKISTQDGAVEASLFEVIVAGAVHDVVQHLVKPVLLRLRVRFPHVHVISKIKSIVFKRV